MSKLHIKSWFNDLYSEDSASRCKCASTPLYKDWLAVSLINQVGSTCAFIMFSVTFFFDWWMTHDGRWCCQTIFGRPDIASVMQLLEDGELLRMVARRHHLPPSVVGRLWRSYQETGQYTMRQGQ